MTRFKGKFTICILFLNLFFSYSCKLHQGNLSYQENKSIPGMKKYVGSNKCRECHIEHYDSWKRTLHSRMLQNTQKNPSVIIGPFNDKIIRDDFQNNAAGMKLNVDDIWIPAINDIRYAIGSQWKQNFIVEKNNSLYIAPIQYNIDSHRWVNYHEEDWHKRPWIFKCAGCHATGIHLETRNFAEPGISCEACHGRGAEHASLPKNEIFKKRQTIINPQKLTMGIAAQICGSCHNRGESRIYKGFEWPVGYEPGKSLDSYFIQSSYANGDTEHFYPNEFSKRNHQQYADWSLSKHAQEGITCLSCHYVHHTNSNPDRSQIREKGSKLCLSCHVQMNKNFAHSIHTFANCVGCHMPRIVASAEPGDIHSHTFVALLPEQTLSNPDIPNSCQSCHKHRYENVEDMHQTWLKFSMVNKNGKR